MADSTRKRIISIEINTIPYQRALNNILDLGSRRQSSYVCFSNAHMTIEAHKSKSFQRMVNQSTYAFADGMPLVFALRWLYGIHQERIAGMDFMGDVLKASEEKQLSVFLYGSSPDILESLKLEIKKKYPDLKLAGMISPPFRALSEQENTAVVDEINSSGANIVLVGLGCPKQEIWMAQNSSHIRACLLGVGGAFGVHAGQAKRAPAWMRQVGLEWFYRWLQEPGRLFVRYATTNTLFVYLIVLQFFKKK